MKPSELKQLIKEEVHSALNEDKKYLNDMSYEELIAHRKRMDFKKASKEEKKYVKDLIDKKKPLDEVADKRPTELERERYTDKEMLTRTTANQFPTNFTILDIIERYEEYVIGYLKDQGKLNETNFGPEVNPNQLASGLNSNREMEKEIVKKQARKEELMDMRVNMLRLMKSFKNLGFSEQEVAKYFEEEVKNKMKNTY